MTINSDDPRLTAYALGELSAEDAVQIQREIQASPQLQREVAEIRAAADALKADLVKEPIPQAAAKPEVIVAGKAPASTVESAKRAKWRSICVQTALATGAVLLLAALLLPALTHPQKSVVIATGPQPTANPLVGGNMASRGMYADLNEIRKEPNEALRRMENRMEKEMGMDMEEKTAATPRYTTAATPRYEAVARYTGTSQPAGADAKAEVPWGKEVDGLACRIVVPKECVPGASIPMAIEVKNISDRKRYIVDLGKIINPDYWVNSEYSTLTISDSQDANKTPWASSKGRTIPPMWIIPIEPKEIKRISLDLNSLSFHSSMFRTPGEYRLTFSFTSPKPERGVVGSKPGKAVPVNMPGGGKGMAMVSEPIYADPTKEQLAGAWTATIESTAVIRVRELMPKELTVHEWGVFSSFNDAKYANANLKREWASMPNFFYHQFPTRRMRFEPAYIEKPIIYFYTDQSKLDLNVKVSFSDGVPVIWWPCAMSPVEDEFATRGLPNHPKQPDVFRAIEWSGFLGGGLTSPTKTVQDSWINQARIEGPVMFTTDATHTTDNRSYRCLIPVSESEQFVYYDGLVPAMDYVRCTDVVADSVTVKNSARFAITNLILTDRRDVKAVRFARVEKIEAGGKAKVALKPVPTSWPAGITKTFGQDLRAAGLFDNEAESVLKIWEKGLFDRPGITAIYLLPQSEYDRMLPMTVAPKPGKVVRVGIALQGQIELTSEIIVASVKELIAKMDSDEYRVRDKATKDLAELGPAAFAAIRKTLAGQVGPEVKTRLEKILEDQDAADYLKPALDGFQKGK